MTVGDFNPVLGSQFNDPLSSFPENIFNLEGNNLEIVYGLLGDDNLSTSEDLTSEEGAFLLGGEGDDQYLVRDGSSVVILETGDSDGDTLVAEGIKINGDNTYGLTIDDRHLYFADLDTDTYILLLDWQSNTVIDTFNFADDTLSFQEAEDLVASLDPNDPESGFLGNFTWQQVQTDPRLVEAEANIDLSEVGLSPGTIDAAIEEVKDTEENFQDTIEVAESGTDIDKELTTEDNSYIFDGDTYYYDFYSIEDIDLGNLIPGDIIDINVSADGFDPLLFVLDSRGNVIDVSEDGDLTFVVGSGEPFFLSVESLDANDTGSYNLDAKFFDTVNTNLVNLRGATEAIVGLDSIGTADTINGSLAPGDIVSSDEDDIEYLGDGYSLTGATVDQQIRVDLDADFDGELGVLVFNSDFDLIEDESFIVDEDLNDDLGSEQITFTIEGGFDYFISVSSVNPGIDEVIGDYTLTTEVI